MDRTMKARVNKNTKQLSSKPASVHNGKNHATTQLVDNRSTTALQLQQMENITHSPQAIAQRQKLDQSFGNAIQRVEDKELLQGRFETVQRVKPGEEKLLQGKFNTAQRVEQEEEKPLQSKFETAQRKPLEEEKPLQGKFHAGFCPIQLQEKPASVNKTGMSDQLKAGIESLSGMDMSDVRVHKNSSKPTQLNALAYAQGNNIHLGSGQEQHLPHEAWHVVQQRQGRVKPTMQMAGEMVNNDMGLEKEADLMGGRAAVQRVPEVDEPKAISTERKHGQSSNISKVAEAPTGDHISSNNEGEAQEKTVQAKWIQEKDNMTYMWDQVLGAFRWYYNSGTEKMFYRIESPDDLSEAELTRLTPFQNKEFKHEEWLSEGWDAGNWDKPDSEVISAAKHQLSRAVSKVQILLKMGVIPRNKEEKGIAPKYWGEALDPMHRPVEDIQKPLRQQYDENPELHLKINFYDWLESQPIKAQVIYMDAGMRQKYRAKITGTKISGENISPKHSDHAFVLTSGGDIYSAPKQTAGDKRIHHSSFTGGASVACAGVFFVQQGSKIFYVKDYSGHYQPGVPELIRLKKHLVSIGGGDIELRKNNGNKYKGPIKDWSET